MRILIIDSDGVGLAFAYRCQQFGHKVRLFLEPGKQFNYNIGMGFQDIQRVDNWVASSKWADLIFFTVNTKYLDKAEAMRNAGLPVYAPTVRSSRLEIDRAFGMKFLEKHGIECPPYKSFNTLREAEIYQMKTDMRHVFKPLGSEDDKSLTYCSKGPADMVAWLQRQQKKGKKNKQPVMLQEFIPGIELAVSQWVGTNGFIGLPNENFEHKPFMSGDIGPGTGEMGTVMKYVSKSKIAEQMLKPIEKDLVALGHFSDIDVNVIVDDKGKAWPLEFTARPGWPAFNIMLSEHKGDPAQWMVDALSGKDTLQINTDVATGVVITVPGFPFNDDDPEINEGIPIFGITDKNRKHIQPQSVMMDTFPQDDNGKIVSKPGWVTCGTYVAVVTGLGPTLAKSMERVYKTVHELQISNSMHRDDIGERVEKQLPELQKLGYCEDWPMQKEEKE